MLSEQAAEARREYRRKWARENKDKVKAQQERYWEKKTKAAKAEQAQQEPAKVQATA